MTAKRRLSSVPEAPRRAVLYVRVSDVRGRAGETFHSPDMQVEAMRRLLARTGGVEVAVVSDLDRSGRTFDREGIQQVLELARAREVDVVALYDLSRLGRNTGESLRYIRQLRDLGVSVVSTVEQIDDSPEGQFMLGQFLGMAQLYSDQIGRRWQQVIARRAEQGLYHGGVAPLGYQRQDGGLVPSDLAPDVRRVFQQYAAGVGIAQIARDFARARGRRTEQSVVKRILRSPVYAGQVRLDGRLYPGRHEPLVDQVTWERVQRRIATDARTPSRTLAAPHSLSGLVVCDSCGSALHMSKVRPRPDGPVYVQLHCRTRNQAGPSTCLGAGSPSFDKVEEEVRSRLLELARGIAADPARPARQAVAKADLTRLRRELKQVEQALSRLTVDHAMRKISDRAYELATADLEESADGLRARVLELEQVGDLPTPRQRVRQAEALLQVWDVATSQERNRGLRLLVSQVRVRRAAYRGEPVQARVEVIPQP